MLHHFKEPLPIISEKVIGNCENTCSSHKQKDTKAG
jgi:hypothetical protein